MELVFYCESLTQAVPKTAADVFRVAEAIYSIATFRGSVIADYFFTLE